MTLSSPHRFHIPVMGIAFTIDSPIKVASFGIASTLSIIEDNLIEVMRKHYYKEIGEPYHPITTKEAHYRSRRITDYLNLMQRIVQEKVESLKNSAFETGSDLVQYFEMLPDSTEVKQKFKEWLKEKNTTARETLEEFLRKQVIPGAIEVNIMTKVDKDQLDKENNPIPNYSDAVTALKGYAESTLTNSAIVFSAGMNPRLFNYMEQLSAFDAKGFGLFDKKVIIKVSDFRSAFIQGKYLAKKGIWVSEFRIESGLNCGGHVFATQGQLLGPILQEFKDKKEELINGLFELYNPAVAAKGLETFEKPHPIKITVQGGIGTAEEDAILQSYYGADGTGWGTPFLLCPEATTVDQQTLNLLAEATEHDVVRSKASPLGVAFNYLKGTTAEKERLGRIANGKPGSPCTEKLLESNTEFTETPICTASRKYQDLKLSQLKTLDLSKEAYEHQKEEVLSKECLCIGLINSAPIVYEEPYLKKLEAVTICPGPNIANFNRAVSLQEMTDHIYGRINIMTNASRDSMFVTELKLYIDFLLKEIKETFSPTKKHFIGWKKYCNNLLDGVAHYRFMLAETDLKEAQTMSLQFKNLAEEVAAIQTAFLEEAAV